MRAPLRLLPAVLLLLGGTAAVAQPAIRGQPQVTPAPAPAPALPGLASRRTPAPIAGDPSVNLSPNAALFDAVNRGDIAAARDAVGRGANLDARNAIGLTPLDAAVDQGRNEIAFYLLSARDLSRGGPPPNDPGPGGLGGPPPVGPATRSAQRRDAELLAAQSRAAARTPSAPRSPRLFANDGGTPQPQIGFLGFDAGRPAGAEPRRGGRG